VKEVAQVTRIVNRLGLHARPAAEFVKLATRFESEVWVEKDGLEVNGKSIMGVMMLAAEPGAEIRIRAVGADAEAALDALLDLVRRGFDDHELEKDLEADGGAW
jgi:phosphocarrier protein